MKIIFASDIHGSQSQLEKLMRYVESKNVDLMVLLGDLLYHGPRNSIPDNYNPKKVVEILNRYKEKIIAVRGNCDAEVDQMLLEFPMMQDSTHLFVDGLRFYCTHGHIYHEDHLPPLAKGTIFVNGHYHVPVLKKENGYVFINPNSITFPKQGVTSYGLYEDRVYRLYDLDTDEILMEMKL